MKENIQDSWNPTAEELMARNRKLSEVSWFAMHVVAQHEKKNAAKLAELGFETYVPVRRELHRWSDRKKWVDVVLTPSLIFVRLALKHKKDIYVDRTIQYFICAPGESVPAPIGDQQMKDFIELTTKESNVQMVQTPLQKGDRVRVLEGPLAGFVGELIRIAGDSKLIVRLNDIMSAAVSVSVDVVEKVPDDTESTIV